jgi:hypothetical protein
MNLLVEIGNREQGTGNREQGTGNREQGRNFLHSSFFILTPDSVTPDSVTPPIAV